MSIVPKPTYPSLRDEFCAGNQNTVWKILEGYCVNARLLMQEVNGAGDCSCINKKQTKNIRTNGARDT